MQQIEKIVVEDSETSTENPRNMGRLPEEAYV